MIKQAFFAKNGCKSNPSNIAVDVSFRLDYGLCALVQNNGHRGTHRTQNLLLFLKNRAFHVQFWFY